MSTRLANLIRKTPALIPAYRIYEALMLANVRTLWRNLRYRWQGSPDGLPIPPAQLTVLVGRSADLRVFFGVGQLCAQTIQDSLCKSGLDIAEFDAMLDFGCGCGRVLRWWRDLERVRVYGCDYNPKPIEWCQKHLTFAQFETNQLSPPLPYADASFDFVYSVSVFTHLSETLQLPWMNELDRVLKPDGCALITTHGEAYFNGMDRSEQREFRAGKLVVHYQEAPGTNLCAAYHPEEYVRDVLGNQFTSISFTPGGAPGRLPQDVFLLRK